MNTVKRALPVPRCVVDAAELDAYRAIWVPLSYRGKGAAGLAEWIEKGDGMLKELQERLASAEARAETAEGFMLAHMVSLLPPELRPI